MAKKPETDKLQMQVTLQHAEAPNVVTVENLPENNEDAPVENLPEKNEDAPVENLPEKNEDAPNEDTPVENLEAVKKEDEAEETFEEAYNRYWENKYNLTVPVTIRLKRKHPKNLYRIKSVEVQGRQWAEYDLTKDEADELINSVGAKHWLEYEF